MATKERNHHSINPIYIFPVNLNPDTKFTEDLFIPDFLVRSKAPSPLVWRFLKSNPVIKIDIDLLQKLMEYSRPFEESASLVAAVRLDTDVSGFIPNLAGPGMNKKKASEILIQVGDEQFNFINSLPYEVQNELHDSFLPNRKFTLRAFIVQNFIQSRSVYELRKYRTDNLFATHLRDITGRNYFQMLEGINKQLPFIHKNVKKDSPFYNGRPIQYIPYFNGRGELIDLEHVMVMLNLGNLEIEKPELIRSGEFDENNPQSFLKLPGI